MTYQYDLIREGSGAWLMGVAGEALENRDLVYLNASGVWMKADSDSVNSPVIGLSLGALGSGLSGRILLNGVVGLSSWTWTQGGLLYGSATAGEITQTPPSGVRQKIGYALTSTLIYFSRDVGGGADTCSTYEGATAYVGFDSCKDGKDNYWYCDGTADDVQINAAQAYVVALGGGTVELERGTFSIIAPIIPTGNDLWFKGQGVDTLIDGDGLATTEHAFHITGRSEITISDMSIQTQGGGTKTCHCIFLEDGSEDFHIYHVIIPDSDDNGIHIEGTTINGGHIHNCHIESTDGHGIYVNMDGGELMLGLHIWDNEILDVGNAGIYFDASDGNNYCTISGNAIIGAAGIGVFLDDSQGTHITGNTIRTSSLSGIHCLGSDFLNVADNICDTNVRHGIFFDQVDNSLVDGNMCNNNDSGDTGTYHGIHTDGSSTDNLITGNQTVVNNGHGIWAEGLRNTVEGNIVSENGLDGIRITAGDCLVNNNRVLDNSQDAAGTYHGILLMGSADRCIVSGNHIDGFGDSQEDGIHLNNGATEVMIIGNYCQDGMGSGIALAAANDDCTINGNFLFENDDYGVEITAGTCDSNRVRENTFEGNVTGAVLNNGTGTIFHTKQYYVARDDDNIGAIPGKSITIGQSAYIAVHAPDGLQQLMAFNIYVIPNATQAAADWDLETDYGAIGEASGLHGETEAAATYNVTDGTWFEIDAVAAGMFASMVEEDTGGISLTVSTAGHNVTVVMAEMYYV